MIRHGMSLAIEYVDEWARRCNPICCDAFLVSFRNTILAKTALIEKLINSVCEQDTAKFLQSNDFPNCYHR